MTWIRLRVEGVALTKADLLVVLDEQAKRFFGDEAHRVEDPVEVEVENYFNNHTGSQDHRWAGRADYVNWKESNQ